jgi:hypothetical protein
MSLRPDRWNQGSPRDRENLDVNELLRPLYSKGASENSPCKPKAGKESRTFFLLNKTRLTITFPFLSHQAPFAPCLNAQKTFTMQKIKFLLIKGLRREKRILRVSGRRE